jgi:hypothetical protein
MCVLPGTSGVIDSRINTGASILAYPTEAGLIPRGYDEYPATILVVSSTEHLADRRFRRTLVVVVRAPRPTGRTTVACTGTLGLITMLRRSTWRWLAITALTLTMTAVAMPASASAEVRCGFAGCLPRVAAESAVAPAGHIGWTYLNLNHCPVGLMCPAIYRESMVAWSWTGTAWRQTSLRQGWAYVYPYTGAWRWAWTQETGWVAVSGGRFELRRF